MGKHRVRCVQLALVLSLISGQGWAADLKSTFDFENAQVLPARVRNPRFKNLVMFIDEKIGGDGIVQPLGNRLNKPVTWGDVIAAQDDDTLKATLEGFLRSRDIPVNGTAGQTTGVVNTYAHIMVPVFAVGVTSRLTLAVAVPVVQVDVNADTGFMRSSDGQHFIDELAATDPAKATEAAAKMNDAVNRKLRRLGYEAISSTHVSNIGDVAVVGKYKVWEGRRDNIAVKAQVTLPTGVAPNANKALDVPTGDGQWDAGGTVLYDHAFTEHLKANAYAGYLAQISDRIEKRIPVSHTEILSRDKEEVDRDLGDIMTAGVSLQYQFDMGLALACGYSLQHQEQATYEGTTYDPSRYRVLEHDTLQQLQNVVLGAGFNGVELYKRHKIPVPFQVNMAYSRPVAGINVTPNDVIAVEASLFF